MVAVSPTEVSYFRLPQTSAVRVPRHKERVYSISVNGSPIAAGNEDIIINIPSGSGEVSVWREGLFRAACVDYSAVMLMHVFTQSLQLLASQINTVDLSQLDPTAVRSIRLLQV